MRKILLFLLLFSINSFAALNLMTWDGSKNTDFNDTANWTGTVASGSTLGTGDSCLINSGAVAATASGAVSIGDLVVTSGYSGNLSFSGQTLTSAGGASFDGTGTLNLGNGVTCNGASGTFHIGSGVGTVTATSCAVTMNGTTAMVIDDDKGVTFKSLTLAASAVVTNSGGTGSIYSNTTTPLTFTNGGTLTINANIALVVTATGNPFYAITGSPTINGNATFYWRNGGTNVKANIPAITVAGTVSVISETVSYSTDTNVMTGNVTIVGAFTARIDNNNLIHTFNTGNFSLSCGTFNLGTFRTGGTLNYNFGSSTITCSSVASAGTGSTVNFNMQTSQWTCTGNWTFGSNYTVDAGTSTVNFTGTAAQTITSNGKSFYDVTINRSTAGTCLFADAASCHTLTASATNTQVISWTGTTMTCSGDMTLDGSGTHILGNGITMTGASGTLHIGSTLTAPTASSCALTMNGTTGMVIDDDKGSTFKSLTLGASAIVTSSGAAATTYSSSSTTLTMGNNSSFTSTAASSFRRSTSGDLYSLPAVYTFNGGGQINFFVNADNITVTLPSLTYTGTGATTFEEAACATLGSTIQLTGAHNYGTKTVYFYLISATNKLTIDLNNQNLTCGALNVGGIAITTGSMTVNYGSGTISVTSYTGSTYNNVCTENFQASQWTCSGNWTNGSNHVIVPGTSTVTFGGSTRSIVTLAGKPLYNVVVAKSVTGTVDTFASGSNVDTIKNNLTLTTGKFYGWAMYIGGDYTNNLTTVGDTAFWKGRKYLCQDFIRAVGSIASVDSPTVFIGPLESDVTTGGTTTFQMYVRKNATAVWKLLDDHTTNRLYVDSGIVVQNKKVLTDSIQIFRGGGQDSAHFDTTVVVYTRDSIGANKRMKFDPNALKQWTGAPICSVWSNSKTRMNTVMNKTGAGGVVSADPLRLSKFILTDGTFYNADTITFDTLTLNSTDTTTWKIFNIRDTIAPVLTFGAGIHPGFLTGNKILSPICNPTITNTWGGTLPTIIYAITCATTNMIKKIYKLYDK